MVQMVGQETTPDTAANTLQALTGSLHAEAKNTSLVRGYVEDGHGHK